VTTYDVTVPVRPGIVVYPGDPPYEITRVASITDGAPANLSAISCTAHTGTHVDAPVHFLPGGGGVETLSLDAMTGPASVVDARAVEGNIDAETLRTLEVPAGAERVLFRTRNSALWRRRLFDADYVALTEDAAKELAARGVRLVGIDYLSVAPYDDPAPTHVALLRAGVVILEGLDLSAVEPGPYTLTCLPLLLEGLDGAPARVLLQS
jgi:arylformamidase